MTMSCVCAVACDEGIVLATYVMTPANSSANTLNAPTPTTQSGTQTPMSDTERKLRQWLQDTRPENTVNGYDVYIRQFEQFCAARKFKSLPADPVTVAEFMRWAAFDRTPKTL